MTGRASPRSAQHAISENAVASSRIARNAGYETVPKVSVSLMRGPAITFGPITNGRRGDVQATKRNSSGAATGSGLQNTALTCPTSAVLAPMPRPMVAMAIAEKPGVRAQRRTASRVSNQRRSSSRITVGNPASDRATLPAKSPLA
jgi:hypothetical protein